MQKGYIVREVLDKNLQKKYVKVPTKSKIIKDKAAVFYPTIIQESLMISKKQLYNMLYADIVVDSKSKKQEQLLKEALETRDDTCDEDDGEMDNSDYEIWSDD